VNNQWKQWLDVHGSALTLFARQHVRCHADAEESVQDGFVRFWRIHQSADDPIALLFSCVKLAAMDVARRDGRRVRREQTVARNSNTESMFVCPVEQRERQDEVEQALNTLPKEQREVLVMKIWGQATFAQIAEALGLSLSTAASRYRYAIGALRKQLTEIQS
jgi:RNA polymerase sigma-70 factor (ECF subfamily)